MVYLCKVRIVTAFLGITLMCWIEIANAQQCRGKYLRYRLVTCGAGQCTTSRDYIALMGDQVIRLDKGEKTGLIYQLGRTVQYSENDVPSVKDIVVAQGFAGARVVARATAAAGSLLLEDTTTYLANRQPSVTLTTSINLQIDNCRTCELKDYEIRIQGSMATKMSRQISCDINDEIRY